MSNAKEQSFSVGDRVRVSDFFFWAKGATGRVDVPPLEVVTLSGPWDDGLTRIEKSALGVNRVYWVGSTNPRGTPMVTGRIVADRSGPLHFSLCHNHAPSSHHLHWVPEGVP